MSSIRRPGFDFMAHFFGMGRRKGLIALWILLGCRWVSINNAEAYWKLVKRWIGKEG